jgi:hypothetical protein
MDTPIAEIPLDAIVVSTTTKTVVETETREWRTIQFIANQDNGEVAVAAVYESVVRVDGQLKSRNVIRESLITWEHAVQIAPSLVQVRAELNAAMPVILGSAATAVPAIPVVTPMEPATPEPASVVVEAATTEPVVTEPST